MKSFILAVIVITGFAVNGFAQEIASNDDPTNFANNSYRGEAITTVYPGNDASQQDVITWQPFDGRHYFSSNVYSVKFYNIKTAKVFSEVRLDNAHSTYLSLPDKKVSFQCFDKDGKPIFEKAKIFHSK